MFRYKQKAQTLSEYAIIIGVVAILLMTMQVYVKRGLQARVKDMTDVWIVTDRDSFLAQYAAGESSSWFTTNTALELTTNLLADSTDIHTNTIDVRVGTQVGVASDEWLDLLPDTPPIIVE